MPFELFSIFFVLIFVFVIGTFIFTFYKMFKTWNTNNKSPRLTVEAKVVDKREHYHRSSSSNNHHSMGTTTYYVTFEVESGDRMELRVPSSEYGYLIVGDQGDLSFQGTRFLSFNRKF